MLFLAEKMMEPVKLVFTFTKMGAAWEKIALKISSVVSYARPTPAPPTLKVDSLLPATLVVVETKAKNFFGWTHMIAG